MPSIRLKLNGKALDLRPPTPSEASIVAFLKKAPVDELFTSRELARRVGLSCTTTKDYGSMAPFEPYSVLHLRKRYWGNPKAIAELRRQLES